MTISKTQFIESISDLPEEVSLDEILDRLMLLQKIELGLKDSDAGKTTNQDEVKSRVKEWFR